MTSAFLEQLVAHASRWMDANGGVPQVALHRDDYLAFTALLGAPVAEKIILPVRGERVSVIPHRLARAGNMYVGHEGAIRRGVPFPEMKP